jgi:polyhydroxyalkanoate synthesis regulator phasin
MAGLTFSKFFPGDWRGGTLYQLTVDEEGMYIRSCAYMWDTGECIPGDDRHASRLLNVQIQRYQKLMGALIEKGKMTRGQGVIFNERVLEEISEFQRQSGHQSIRAKRGHATKKLTANAVKELMEEVERLKQQLAQPPTLPPDQPPVAPRGGTPGGSLGGTPDVPAGVMSKKSNEINEHEQNGQKTGTAESRSQNPEARKEEVAAAVPRTAALPASDLDELERKLFDACNGALDNPVNCLGLLNLAVPQMWLENGCDLERDVLPTLRAIGKRDHGKRIKSWTYFTNAVTCAKAAREAGLPEVEATPRKIRTPMGSDWSEIAKKAREQGVRK